MSKRDKKKSKSQEVLTQASGRRNGKPSKQNPKEPRRTGRTRGGRSEKAWARHEANRLAHEEKLVEEQKRKAAEKKLREGALANKS